MKQHIIEKQLNELSEEGKEKLAGWYGQPERRNHRDNYCVVCNKPLHTDNKRISRFILPLLSIGQMIEFLGDNNKRLVEIVAYYSRATKSVVKNYEGELCDALWEAVKEVLEK